MGTATRRLQSSKPGVSPQGHKCHSAKRGGRTRAEVCHRKEFNMQWISHTLSWIELHPGLAAWTQAIFSILAIGVAIMVSKKQFNDAQALQANRQKAQQIEIAEVVEALSRIALNVVAYAATFLRNQQAIQDIAEFRRHFDLPALVSVERKIESVPIAQMSGDLIAYVFMLSGTVRQVRELAEKAFGQQHEMNEAEFKELWNSVTGLQLSLKKTSEDIQQEVVNIRSKKPN